MVKIRIGTATTLVIVSLSVIKFKKLKNQMFSIFINYNIILYICFNYSLLINFDIKKFSILLLNKI